MCKGNGTMKNAKCKNAKRCVQVQQGVQVCVAMVTMSCLFLKMQAHNAM